MSDKASFEICPPPFDPRAISKWENTEIVVLGCGISGLCAALSAAEAGAKVILLEKTASFNQRGVHNAAIDSRMQKAAGIQIDKDRVIYTMMEWGDYRADQRVIKTWADNCGKVMDWLLDMAEAAQVQVVLDPSTKDWYFPNYPLIHVFLPKYQETLARMLLNNAKTAGVDFRFETPGVRLLRDGKSRVYGVIAQNKDGEYIQFNVNKAVILCTGDYGADREMIEKYCWPSVSKVNTAYIPRGVNTGDGHKMGLWVGAAIDEPPHCPVLFDFANYREGEGALNVLPRQPWLYVNSNGERFMNEDLPWGYECAQMMRQPGGIAWSMWDDKYEDEMLNKLNSQCCKNPGPPTYFWEGWQKALLDGLLKDGGILTAPNIEELANKIEVPVENLKSTVARYNEMARNGKDLDYGKHPERLTTLEKPPFYACQMHTRFLVILSGLQINNKMQVLDTEGEVIPGLYAAGNTSGSFFGSQYPTTTPGATHSRAFTFGRLAGLNAAAEKPANTR